MPDAEIQKQVLFVDDEQPILSSLKRTLRKEPYTTLTADNAQDALEIVKNNSINVVVSDQRMPDMAGTDFLQKVKEVSPFTARAILSGYANADVIVDSINKGEVYRFIPKPWEFESLTEAVNQCLLHNEVLLGNNELVKKANAKVKEFKSKKSELENTVEQRNMILEYTQEMLEYMPISVIGVNRDGEILICNEHARTSIAELSDFNQMTMFEDAFSTDLWNTARESLKVRIAVQRLYMLAGGEYEFRFIPIVQSRINGLLVVIERKR